MSKIRNYMVRKASSYLAKVHQEEYQALSREMSDVFHLVNKMIPGVIPDHEGNRGMGYLNGWYGAHLHGVYGSPWKNMNEGDDALPVFRNLQQILNFSEGWTKSQLNPRELATNASIIRTIIAEIHAQLDVPILI